MKKVFVLIILLSAFAANAQSLKDALYRGKLKLDSSKVIKKTEDWTADTITVQYTDSIKAAEVAKINARNDSIRQSQVALTDSVSIADGAIDSADIVSTVPKDNATITLDSNKALTKDNNKIWKDYIDEFKTTLQTEVIPNKKIKNGIYSVLIEYEIGLDGGVSINNVSVEPESDELQKQVKQRLTMSAPQMVPLLNSAGKPRKAVKKYTLTLNK